MGPVEGQEEQKLLGTARVYHGETHPPELPSKCVKVRKEPYLTAVFCQFVGSDD